MEVKHIDAHCHLQFGAYDADREAILEKMREEGVAGIVVGCDCATSEAAVALAEQHDHLYAVVGQHPNHAPDEVFDLGAYRALASHPKVVAVGECGLDYYRPDDPTLAQGGQRELFLAQCALAQELDKPLVIHSRPSKGTMDAYHDVIEILKDVKKGYPGLRGDMHFFVGGVEEAKAFIELGFTLSFTAVITFARDYDEVIRTVPLTSILAETDAPYVAPASRRGKRNDPLAVVDVVNQIASIRGEDLELVRTTLLSNTKRLFGI